MTREAEPIDPMEVRPKIKFGRKLILMPSRKQLDEGVELTPEQTRAVHARAQTKHPGTDDSPTREAYDIIGNAANKQWWGTFGRAAHFAKHGKTPPRDSHN